MPILGLSPDLGNWKFWGWRTFWINLRQAKTGGPLLYARAVRTSVCIELPGDLIKVQIISIGSGANGLPSDVDAADSQTTL